MGVQSSLPQYITCYDSVEAFLDKADSPTDLPESRRASLDTTFRSTWVLGCDLNEAMKLARTGWPEGTEKVYQALELIKAKVKPRTLMVETVYKHDGGAYVDVGRMLGGDPECFGTFQPPEAPRRPLRLVVNYAKHNRLDDYAIVNWGAAVVALIDILETCGFRVECSILHLVQSSYEKEKLGQLIKLKDFSQDVDLDRFSFCLAHPAFLRRITFAEEERYPARIRKEFGFEGGYYGVPIDSNASTLDSDLYIPMLVSNSSSACIESAAELMERFLNKVDSNLFEEVNN